MKPWRVRLICCGREDDFYYADSWEEADSFRLSYTQPGQDSHERSAIIERTGDGGTHTEVEYTR